MTQLTPNLSLVLYNSTTDQAATFAAFRADMAGISGTSNFSLIDTAYGTLEGRVDTLELIKSAILINASFISSNYYEATTALMTAYTTGMSILLNLDTDSAGTVTLKINALATLSVMKIDSTGTPVNISGGDLQSGRYYLFIYDGTRWVWADATSADQVYHGGTTGNAVLVASDGSLSASTPTATLVGSAINSATSKSTPVDADEIGILDSAASFVLKKFTWANLKSTFLTYWYSIFNGWIPDTATWTYSSIDGATGVASVNADKTSILQKGMRVAYEQVQALTAYWTFNTNSNSDVGSFNGTDTAMTYTAGQFSNAATFNGTTSKIVLADSASLKPTGDYTIGLWFKTSNTGANKALFTSFSLNPNWAGMLLLVNSTNTLSLYHGKNTGTVNGVDYTLLSGTATVTDGNWHYLVVSYKSNYAQIYLDGRLESSGYMVSPVYAGTTYIRTGCQNNSGTDLSFMNGQIDDLYIINGYALDEKTIYDKYIAATAQGTGNITVSKMGIITNVGAYSGGNTLVTFWGGTDYSLVNATISNPKYSNEKVPYGFPTSPNKWSVMWFSSVDPNITTNTTTYQNALGANIVVPIGNFLLNYSVGANATQSVAGTCQPTTTLSTTTSTETIALTTVITAIAPVTGYTSLHTINNYEMSFAVKTTLYFLFKAGVTTTSLHYYAPLNIKATISYL